MQIDLTKNIDWKNLDLAELEPLAESGNGDALFLMSRLKSRGFNRTPINYKESLQYAKQGAKTRHGLCKYEYGNILYSGSGVPAVTKAGSRLITESQKDILAMAYQGSPIAQNALGRMHQTGIGVPQDYTIAFAWFQHAAEHGEPSAQNNLANMYLNGLGVEKNIHQASDWLFKSIEQGNANAMYDFGYRLLNGEGVTLDKQKAIKLLQQGAEQGHPDAMCVIGHCYLAGDGVNKNPTEAERWLKSASDVGIGRAKLYLADCYSSGDGITQDCALAYSLYSELLCQEALRAETSDRMTKLLARTNVTSKTRGDHHLIIFPDHTSVRIRVVKNGSRSASKREATS